MEVWRQNVGMISDPHVSSDGLSQPDLEHQNLKFLAAEIRVFGGISLLFTLKK